VTLGTEQGERREEAGRWRRASARSGRSLRRAQDRAARLVEAVVKEMVA
jgi:hypothetical protein